MVAIKPFKAIRPKADKVEEVVCPPYDVLEKNAIDKLADNPINFVHIIRSEVDLGEGVNPHDDIVYAKASDNLNKFQEDGILVEEESVCFYIYRQIRRGRVQNGLVGCVNIDDYVDEKIRKHELTRIDKEKDRINHFHICNAQTEPVFLFYEKSLLINNLINNYTEDNFPIYDFVTSDEVKHIVWKISDEAILQNIIGAFQEIDILYIADGHHRSASAAKVGLLKREENNGASGEYEHFQAVIFPAEELLIMPYNRVVKDLNGHSEEQFLKLLQNDFIVKKIETIEEPKQKGDFTMIIKNNVYSLTVKEHNICDDVVSKLDASILQNKVLSPLLGIEDPRTDPNIEFYGGDDMLENITDRLNNDMKVAFLLYPTQINEIISVSREKKIMPPKSTWFEPKLLSGLFVHRI